MAVLLAAVLVATGWLSLPIASDGADKIAVAVCVTGLLVAAGLLAVSPGLRGR